MTKKRDAVLPDRPKPEPERVSASVDPTRDPRELFYQISSEAITKGLIDWQVVNPLVTRAGQSSFAEVLHELVAIVEARMQSVNKIKKYVL